MFNAQNKPKPLALRYRLPKGAEELTDKEGRIYGYRVRHMGKDGADAGITIVLISDYGYTPPYTPKEEV